jgi:hypothetical protein
MNAQQRQVIRAAAAERAAVTLPDPSPEFARHIAEMLRGPINQYVAAQRAIEPLEGPPEGRTPRRRGKPSNVATP